MDGKQKKKVEGNPPLGKLKRKLQPISGKDDVDQHVSKEVRNTTHRIEVSSLVAPFPGPSSHAPSQSSSLEGSSSEGSSRRLLKHGQLDISSIGHVAEQKFTCPHCRKSFSSATMVSIHVDVSFFTNLSASFLKHYVRSREKIFSILELTNKRIYVIRQPESVFMVEEDFFIVQSVFSDSVRRKSSISMSLRFIGPVQSADGYLSH